MPALLCSRSRVIVATLALCGLAGCETLEQASTKAANIVSPYKITIVQGNVVTQEQLAYLKPGMPRAVVRDVLGTPLLASVFHAQRWDYIFTFKRQGAPEQSRKVTVYFAKDVLERVEADDLPSEKDFVSTLKSNPLTGPLPVLEASEERLKSFPPPAPKELVAPTPSAPVAYPPLEPVAP